MPPRVKEPLVGHWHFVQFVKALNSRCFIPCTALQDAKFLAGVVSQLVCCTVNGKRHDERKVKCWDFGEITTMVLSALDCRSR